MNNNINNYKIMKIVELVLFTILEIVFLIILISNKAMRSSIFVDKSLFILCTFAYVSVLGTFAMLIHDFIEIKDMKKQAFELEQLAFFDKKTGIPNKSGCSLFFKTYATEESLKGVCCVVTEIANIKAINKQLGKNVGDLAINDFTKLFEKVGSQFGFVGRNGGNEFITVIENCDEIKIKKFNIALFEAVENYNSNVDDRKIIIHSEYVINDYDPCNSFSELISKAYTKLGR